MENPTTNQEENGFIRLVKSFVFFLLLVLVIVACFWVSFQLGKRILVPVKEPAAKKINVTLAAASSPEVYVYQEDEQKKNTAAVTATTQPKVVVPITKPLVTQVKKVAPITKQVNGQYYKVVAGLFKDKEAAISLVNRLNVNGVATYLRKTGSSWRVQVGAYKTKSQAVNLKNSLNAKGFNAS